jgi:hypothetical protein
MPPSWGQSSRRRISPCTSALHSLIVDKSLRRRKLKPRELHDLLMASTSARTVPPLERCGILVVPTAAQGSKRALEETSTRDQSAHHLPTVPRDRCILSLFRTTMSSPVDPPYCWTALRIKQPRVQCMFNHHRGCCLGATVCASIILKGRLTSLRSNIHRPCKSIRGNCQCS